MVQRYIVVHGQLFFGTMSDFGELFDVVNDAKHISVDFSASHVWDHSAVAAIAKIVLKYQQLDKEVSIIGLNDGSLRRVV